MEKIRNNHFTNVGSCAAQINPIITKEFMFVQANTRKEEENAKTRNADNGDQIMITWKQILRQQKRLNRIEEKKKVPERQRQREKKRAMKRNMKIGLFAFGVKNRLILFSLVVTVLLQGKT